MATRALCPVDLCRSHRGEPRRAHGAFSQRCHGWSRRWRDWCAVGARLVCSAAAGLRALRRWNRSTMARSLVCAHQKGCRAADRPLEARPWQDTRRPPRRHVGQIMSEIFASATAPAVSIVVPVRNEADNIAPLVDEIAAALDKDLAFELIYVNDGSTDRTQAELTRLMASRPWLRQIRHEISCGQSAAVSSGVIHARAAIVITLDGDGQNDPAFIPALLEAMTRSEEHTSELQSRPHLVCRLLLEKKKKI